MMGFAYALMLLAYSSNYAIVDFSKPDTEPRLYIYNSGGILLYKTYVAHGTGSGRGKYAVYFSNDFNSHASSLGRYQIIGIYYGTHGKCYKLRGLNNSNYNAYAREIELHGAYYIGPGKTGHSFGCFAVPMNQLNTVMKYLKPGDYIIAED